MRHAFANLLLHLLAWVCDEHVPTMHTDPIRCAVCWRPLGAQADWHDE